MTEETDSLRSTIEAAFAAEPTAVMPAEAAPPLPGGTPAKAGLTKETARDGQGRFAAAPAVIPAILGSQPEDRIQLADTTPPDSGTPASAGVTKETAAPAAVASPPAPPPGWSIKSKADFDALPAHVRDDIAKRETEISNGFAKLGQYKGLDPFVDMAKAAGRTLPEVVQSYVKAEEMLGQDFGRGIRELCRMYNVDPARLGQHLSGNGESAPSPAGPPDPLAPVLDRLQTVDRRLEQWERQMAERETESVQTELTRFAADPAHRYFENVRQTMGQIMAVNPQASLSEAYDQACWMNPEIRPLRIKEQTDAVAEKSRAVAESARRASGSLPTGSPIPGAVPGGAPAKTLRAELERAFDQARI
jgi:hypothetical protein